MSETRLGACGDALIDVVPAVLGWRATVVRCAAEAGPFDVRLVAAWSEEIEAVRGRVGALEAGAACCAAGRDGAVSGYAVSGDAVSGDGVRDDGSYALVALAAARSGALWSGDQLVAVGAAVELAYRATRHHDQVSDRRDASLARDDNRRHVLDGDWSITQAAVLVADIGPAAYRLLVRGYGAAQVARFDGRAPTALFGSARSLGHLVAGVPDFTAAVPGSVGDRVYQWACGAR